MNSLLTWSFKSQKTKKAQIIATCKAQTLHGVCCFSDKKMLSLRFSWEEMLIFSKFDQRLSQNQKLNILQYIILSDKALTLSSFGICLCAKFLGIRKGYQKVSDQRPNYFCTYIHCFRFLGCNPGILALN